MSEKQFQHFEPIVNKFYKTLFDQGLFTNDNRIKRLTRYSVKYTIVLARM